MQIHQPLTQSDSVMYELKCIPQWLIAMHATTGPGAVEVPAAAALMAAGVVAAKASQEGRVEEFLSSLVQGCF